MVANGADWTCNATATRINSGREFHEAMYWEQYSRNGCIRLLNTTHQLGCSSQGPVEAPIQKYSSASLPLEGAPFNAPPLPSHIPHLSKQGPTQQIEHDL